MAISSVTTSPSTPSSSPIETINSSIDKLMDQLDQEIAQKTTDEMAKFDDICALVNQILALMQANQKKLSKELSHLQAKAREHHHCCSQEAHNGKSVMIITIASASLSAMAGLSHVAPGAVFKGGEAINNAVSRNVFELARFNNDLQSFAQAASGAFGGFAQAAGGVQSIAGDRRQSHLQEHNSCCEHAKTDKQAEDQEVSAATSRLDAAINATKDHLEKLHRIKQSMMGA